MDPNRGALHLLWTVGVNSAGAKGAGHVTGFVLASLVGRSFGLDGQDGQDGPEPPSAALLWTVGENSAGAKGTRGTRAVQASHGAIRKPPVPFPVP